MGFPREPVRATNDASMIRLHQQRKERVPRNRGQRPFLSQPSSSAILSSSATAFTLFSVLYCIERTRALDTLEPTMATPASSATTPSPPLAYLQPVVDAAAAVAATSPNSSATEQESRQHAISKIMARAEFSKVSGQPISPQVSPSSVSMGTIASASNRTRQAL